MYATLALLAMISVTEAQQTAVVRQSIRAPGFSQVTVQRGIGIGANVHAANFNRLNVNVGLNRNVFFPNQVFNTRFNNIDFVNRNFALNYGLARSFYYQPVQAIYQPVQAIYAPQMIYQVPQATYVYPAQAQETYAPPQAQAYYAPAPVQYQYEVQQAIQYLAAPSYAPAYYAPYYIPRYYGQYGIYNRSFQFGIGRRY